MKIGIIGLGFVGGSVQQSLLSKGFLEGNDLFSFDKFKNGGIGTLDSTLHTDILFLALPTPFHDELKYYDKTAIYSVCEYLNEKKYSGVILLKSTVEPETTSKLSETYSNLYFIHNPEFLTARTALKDFNSQTHVVLGLSKNVKENQTETVVEFYKNYYPQAHISLCSSIESESMKIFCNSFYAIKVQFFTEIYSLCQKNAADYNVIRDLMLRNKWIHPMHTIIPGPDGNISYGGLCFPKDTNALNQYMKSYNSIHSVLEATIIERNILRDD